MAQVGYVTYRIEPERPDPNIDWASYQLVLLRSAWDYVPRFAEFMTWARRVSALTRLLPPLEVTLIVTRCYRHMRHDQDTEEFH